ncbi:Thiamine-monophosphate kinase [uncultured delta proteobacterium]|uniref:Thiamine-monophosphate kinase n=1 Tax=uncultured delta proteobacterium TaxID=34034 RepID=A0A212IUX2_9DELT|nr:Thiamine-monophosphate kinase [uncultured delta proteobacterium]
MNAYIASEDDFLALIASKFPNEHASLVLGRGDDCAEIACPPQMAVSTDLFVEDIHFRRAYFTPFETGYKAMAVNISDMAAAGAKPLGVSVGLITPVPFPREEAEGILDGMLHAARQHDIALTGGDLSRGEKLAFCVTIWGAPAIPATSGPRFLRRGPVAPGDALFACGTLGLARAGLFLLEERGRRAESDFPAACAAHLMPVPQVRAGLVLAGIPGCRLMDVSDGLARDLPRMLAAHGTDCGAAITLPEAFLHPETSAFARAIGENPARFAFLGGEDYALLGACPPGSLDRAAASIRDLPGDVPFLLLGTVTEKKGIMLNGERLADAGFDHFSRK